MKRKIQFFFISLFIFTILVSCSYKITPQVTKNSKCLSSIEGNYNYSRFWSKKAPAIVTAGSFLKARRLIYGDILEIKDDGIRFLQKKENVLHRVKEKFYYFKDLECVIDSNKNVIHGSIAKDFERDYILVLFLSNANDSTSKPYRLRLQPNKSFGFCMSPGMYNINSFVLMDTGENYRYIFNPSGLRVKVDSNVTNYVGNIHVNNTDLPDKYLLDLNGINGKGHATGNVGAMFGLIGPLAVSLSIKGGEKEMSTSIKVVIDKEFKPRREKFVKINPIFVDSTTSKK